MLYDGFEAIIGLEVHVQLRTQSKMFCGCALPPDQAAPNRHICPICLGHPGTLPTLNAEAVVLGIRAGLALGGTVHPVSRFARKNYFYPDLPKGYQISQAERPLVTGGRLHTPMGDFGIHRMHLEEDSGKMLHSDGATVVDWNRAGVPLLEIVGEPDLRSPAQAEAWLRGLHRVLVEGGICGGDLEKGQFRCDVNVSVHRPEEPWGPRTEIKNVNSFRFVARALKYEIDRQIQALRAGEALFPETRTWNGNRTLALRRKETAAEYRYFSEPDLPPLMLTPEEFRRAREGLAGVPLDLHLLAEERRQVEEWQQRYGISAYDVGVLQAVPEAADFFVATVSAGAAPRSAASLVMGEWMRRWNGEGLGQLQPGQAAALLALMDGGTINREGARQILDHLVEEGGEPSEWAQRLGLQTVCDAGALRAIVERLREEHPSEHQRYKAGNKGIFGFFVGELMKATGRKADPKLAALLVREVLDR